MTWVPRPSAIRRYYLLVPVAAFAVIWVTLLLMTGRGVWTARPIETIRATGIVYEVGTPGELDPAAGPVLLDLQLTPTATLRRPDAEPGYWLVNRPLAGRAQVELGETRLLARLGASQLLVVTNLGYWILLPFLGALGLLATYILEGGEEPDARLTVARVGLALLTLVALIPGLPGLLWMLNRFVMGIPAP
ncbi:MAG TPA: hypothetical protein VLK32_02990 [Bacillota bacterium]|nr:hypothetical protein [Bacillota bacterium]